MIGYISLAVMIISAVVIVFLCVKSNAESKKREIRGLMEELGKLRNGLLELDEMVKVLDYLGSQMNRANADNKPVDVNDVEFASGTDLPNTSEGTPEDINGVFDDTPSAGLSIEDIEAAFEAGTFAETYKSNYLHQPDKKFKASAGKCVLIRPEHHRIIQQILSAANAECVTIYGFIDNILCEHFTRNAINIDEILNPYNKRV